ncbi:MAG: PEP-CTERM sorting domain-containing protein [Candidatus Acidiferrales bacterium]
MKAFKLMAVIAVVLFASSIVRADGVDARVNVNPGPDPILPSCGSAQFMADSTGAFNVACDTTVLTTQITFAALDVTTQGGLSCASNLTSLFNSSGPLAQFNWTGTTSNNAGGVDSCTFTAPAIPTGWTATQILNLLTAFGIVNDGDCDNDDFIFGIAAGCAINFNTNGNGTMLFTANAQGDISTNGAALIPFPEPSSLGLVGIGIVALLVGRRRFKNGSALQVIS